MRKVLIFLLAFGSGLCVLLMLRTDKGPPVHGGNGVTTDTEHLTDLSTGDGDGAAIQVGLNGRLTGTRFFEEEIDGERRKQYVLTAEDTRPLGDDVYELTNLRVVFFELETGELLAEAESSQTEMRIETDERGGYTFGQQMSISNVELTLHRGAPVVPITMRVPLLQGSLEDGRFRSNDLVQLDAQGIEAEGTGLEVNTARSSLRLVRDGRIELDLERGGSVVLEAIGVGPIDFLKRGTEEAPEVEIRAGGNARFTLDGQSPILAVGDEIVIRAGSAAGTEDDRRFRASEAFITGGATVEGADSIFRSRRADVAFDELGRLQEVLLVGDPTGRVQVAPFLDPEEHPELHASYADIRGEGPLRITFTEGTGLDLSGHGSVEIPDLGFKLTANERIVGWVGIDQTSGEVEATGGVRIEHQDRELESEAIAIRFAAPAPGEEAVDMDTDGPTRLRGTDPEGRPVTIVANGGGSFRSRAGRLSAPIVRDVRVEAIGENGYVARADLVRDFDLTSRVFTAEGNVVYETREGRGSGERAFATGPEEIELHGGPQGPALFQLWETAGDDPDGANRIEQGRTEAGRIVASRGRVSASKDVTCVFALSDEQYRMRCQELDIEYELEPDQGRRPFKLRARRECRVELRSPIGDASLESDELDVDGVFHTPEPGAPEEPAEPSTSLGRSALVARGNVEIDYAGRAGLRGEADRFSIDERGKGRLSMEDGGRVYAVGRLPGFDAPYEMTAEWIEFTREGVDARKLQITLLEEHGDGGTGAQEVTPGEARTGQSGSGVDPAPTEPGAEGSQVPASERPVIPNRGVVLDINGVDMRSRPDSILLEGDAHMDGLTEQGEVWSIDAGAIQMLGRFDGGPRGFALEDVDLLEARGGFVAKLGDRMEASGRKLAARQGRVRLEGAPARFRVSDITWESDWIELDADNLLVGTGRGTLRPRSELEDWTLTYESMQPFDDVDATMLVLRNPLFRSEGGEREIRAAWALFWLDKSGWTRSTGELIGSQSQDGELHVGMPGPSPATAAGAGDDSERIEEFAGILNEIYIEGNIEFLENDRRIASAQAYYLNRLDGHGWMQDANVLMDIERQGKTETIRVKARWMRVSADLQTRGLDLTRRFDSVRADKAVITSCGFEEPHYVIETGDLRVNRNDKSAIGYDLSARKNRARFLNGLVIPLPPLNFGTDDEGNPTIGGFEVGDSARFGSVVRATASLPLPDWTRRMISTPMSLEKEEITGGTRMSLGFLSSRGLLFGVGQQIRASDKMWLDVFYDAVPDSGKDRGMVRSKTDRNTEYRDWLHARGRLLLDEGEWIDLAFTKQSDAGFQAEFFEREYTRYEEQDNFLHWRKSDDAVYYTATVGARLEDFRTVVEELPSAGAYFAPSPVADIGGQSVLYSADAVAGYYRRKFGEAPFSPFGPTFADPDIDGDLLADDFEVLRFDTSHKLEAPIPLGVAGIKATPYIAGRATVWDQGVEKQDAPSRFAGFVGVQLGTSVFRHFGNGSIHQLLPTVGLRTDIVSEESGDTLVQIDGTELPIEGDFVDLGLRSLWWVPDATEPRDKARLDVELRATHASSTQGQDGWIPIRVLGEGLNYFGSVPIGITHDGRYDVRDDKTVYSLSSLGIEPIPRLGFEFGYQQGRNEFGASLFRAASVGTRYRASSKWEFGVEHAISLLDEDALNTTVLVRRLGHDFVTELEYQDRAGEGNSIGISIQPQLSWRRTSLGLLDKWLGTYR
jgi:hypothetical protein